MIEPERWAKHSLGALSLSFLIFSTSAVAQAPRVGSVDFPTSGDPRAQVYFLRGVAELHSFWYEEALDNFKQAAAIDPEFMMAYWGQAMCYNHPVWQSQDTDAARTILQKIDETPALSAREKGYLNAVKALYGVGDKHQRDLAYADAMARLHHDYPQDLEAACFYALSLLGSIGPGENALKKRMEAGAIALEVFAKNPDHPGAAHYIIHAFDDPDHAVLALPAALRYSRIAPAAFHAVHMPSHIFVQLGMWPEAAASNESAWAVSGEWVERKHISTTFRDYHSLHWLTYVYLQQGRYARAAELIASLKGTIQDGPEEPSPEMIHSLASMEAEYVVETRDWGKAVAFYGGDSELSSFIRGLGQAELRRASGRKSAERSYAVTGSVPADPARSPKGEVMALEVGAVSKAAEGSYAVAFDLIKRAISIEDEKATQSGPPDPIKPPRELLGEILLDAGCAKDAVDAFNAALVREPNRSLSLLGRARALAQSGRTGEARATYQALLQVWGLADSDLPALQEAVRYVAAPSVAR
ncbi:MAG TPA: tetratricopeptide repeat protein [Blastocatellia bacterium]